MTDTRMAKDKPFANAMAFYHRDGLPAAWKHAMAFADKGGRLATMPDIAAARCETAPGDVPWETYFTTLSAEYVGIGRDGQHRLIVAHGVGPMATLEGIQEVYGWEYQDKSRSRRGGRITQEEFWKLESGGYGEVAMVNLEPYCKYYEYPFLEVLRYQDAVSDPVLQARLGSWATQCIELHAIYARRWHREKAGLNPDEEYRLSTVNPERFHNLRLLQHARYGASDSNPYIIKVDGAANCPYFYSVQHGFAPIEDGYAFAHLISTGGLSHLCHQDGDSLTLDVGCHEWWNGTRVVGIKAGGSIRRGLNKGPDVHRLLRKHWRDLLVSAMKRETLGLCALMQIGDQWFTQYPKVGEQMDTWEPEYVITSMEKLGEPTIFRTTVGGYHGFFKFGVNEVQAIAPPNANAYFFVGEPENEWHDGNPTHQTCKIQFYRIEADTSKRVVRADNLARDYGRLIELVAKESEAA